MATTYPYSGGTARAFATTGLERLWRTAHGERTVTPRRRGETGSREQALRNCPFIGGSTSTGEPIADLLQRSEQRLIRHCARSCMSNRSGLVQDPSGLCFARRAKSNHRSPLEFVSQSSTLGALAHWRPRWRSRPRTRDPSSFSCDVLALVSRPCADPGVARHEIRRPRGSELTVVLSAPGYDALTAFTSHSQLPTCNTKAMRSLATSRMSH